jgi:hypothetical protein
VHDARRARDAPGRKRGRERGAVGARESQVDALAFLAANEAPHGTAVPRLRRGALARAREGLLVGGLRALAADRGERHPGANARPPRVGLAVHVGHHEPALDGGERESRRDGLLALDLLGPRRRFHARVRVAHLARHAVEKVPELLVGPRREGGRLPAAARRPPVHAVEVRVVVALVHRAPDEVERGEPPVLSQPRVRRRGDRDRRRRPGRGRLAREQVVGIERRAARGEGAGKGEGGDVAGRRHALRGDRVSGRGETPLDCRGRLRGENNR